MANYNSVDEGHLIVKTAMDAYGRIDILINNAGILRDKSMKTMEDKDWDLVLLVHLRGSYKVTKAAWDIMRKQNYGRIINTASAAGLYGNYGQANYSAAKMALHGFTMSLAREGAKSNIKVNTIAPLAASRMTESVLPKELLDNLKPEFVAPLVMALTHDSTEENGAMFEVGAGYVAKLRRERSRGAIFKTDSSFLPGAIKKRWDEINNFKNATHPDSIMEVDWMGILEQAKTVPANAPNDMTFSGRVAIITGSGAGLGRAYAHLFAKLGAAVVVNDLGSVKNSQGTVVKAADVVVEEIKAAGGKAVANYDSVEDGDKVVETAIKAFGRVDIIVNNAGIIRDKSFSRLTDQDWDLVQRVHLRGTFKVTKAAWPYFLKQKYGRIINTASAVGLYGNFGQANYSAAKSGIIGLSNTLAIEGAKSNIIVNTIAPNAGTAMTATIMPPEMVEALKPDYVAPLVAFLAHETNTTSSAVFEVGSGWISRVRWQRAGGKGFPVNVPLKPEHIAQNWKIITDFDDGRAHYPTSTQESFQAVMDNMSNRAANGAASTSSDAEDPAVAKAKELVFTEKFSYSECDSIIYNLGVGATRNDLDLVYENDDGFKVLPSFGVIPAFPLMLKMPLSDIIGNFNPMMLLHGEQYLEIKNPLPTSCELVNEGKIVDILDKGKGAVVVVGVTSKDKTGKVLCYNEYSNFIRGIKGVGNKATKDRGAATATNDPPQRPPDAVVTEKTSENQAALYRLSGDYNPLHIDPQMSKMGGFDVPILHGLCSFGIATKHVFRTFANNDPAKLKSVKVRFAKHVFPGETLRTEMWKSDDGKKIIFQVRVLERDVLAITNAAVELTSPSSGITATKSASIASVPGSALPAVEGFKASSVFQQISASLQAMPQPKREQEVKKSKAIFQFSVTNSAKKTANWYIDLKNGQGSVGTGSAKGPDVTISIGDDDFVQLASGKLNAQKAFMAGKIKVKGQMMLATKLDGLLKTLLNSSKL